MLRLALLLMGTDFVRRRWRALSVFGAISLVLGVALFIDALDGVIYFPLRAFGFVMLLEAAVTLAIVPKGSRTMRALRYVKALLSVIVALLIIGRQHRFDMALAILFGVIFTLDGGLRIASAAVVRFHGWRMAVGAGVLELLFAIFLFEPLPTYYAGTAEYCIGVWLFLAGWSMLRLALRLRVIPAGASVAHLLNRGNDGLPPVYPFADSDTPAPLPLTVHVWTAAGTADKPLRQPVVDRYIAAVDAQGVVSTGHAALEAPPDLYISHYPAVEIEHDPDEFMRILRATDENNVEGLFQPSYPEEAAGWCESTRKIVFSEYDSVRLRAFWADYSRDNTYNLTYRNCSSTVVLALETALEGVAGKKWGRNWATFARVLLTPELWVAGEMSKRGETMAWTPGLALDFVRAMHTIVHPPNDIPTSLTQMLLERSEQVRRLRDRHNNPSAEPMETAETVDLELATPPNGRRLASSAAVIAVAAIFGLSYGLTSPLIASNLESRGGSALLIGLNAAMHALGVLLIAPFLPRLTARFGARALIVTALALSASVLTIFPHVSWIWLWFPMRLLLGIAAETLFVLSETWTNDLSDARSRGQMMAIYTAALSIGFAGGPAIVSLAGPGRIAYMIGAALAALAAIPILLPWVLPPARTQAEITQPWRYLQLAPIAIATTLLNAGVETAGLSFIALYAMHNGWTERSGLRLVSVLMFGAVLLQLPIGWLADKVNPRRLALALAILSTLGALLWPLTLSTAWIAYTMAFVWGGVFVGIYTVMLTIVGSRFRGGDLVGVYAIMSVAWGIGALVGPFLVGSAMSVSPKYGFPYAVALGCALFAGFMAVKRTET
ncbi:hypothetical protein CCAX7_64990 [Capsulimonas corticalis]|uniref:Uncharacterized protein n=1 Tax=Capsulimonas corticalis TaxID=2219043 RepID=A0A402CQW9_9BACT|nr:MFS transporter [Capsulimonas corticalis]BDI34448.1 hypothetical protein CCAX7_64990 [Capsulimonas corticalis]